MNSSNNSDFKWFFDETALLFSDFKWLFGGVLLLFLVITLGLIWKNYLENQVDITAIENGYVQKVDQETKRTIWVKETETN